MRTPDPIPKLMYHPDNTFLFKEVRKDGIYYKNKKLPSLKKAKEYAKEKGVIFEGTLKLTITGISDKIADNICILLSKRRSESL